MEYLHTYTQMYMDVRMNILGVYYVCMQVCVGLIMHPYVHVCTYVCEHLQ